MLSLNESLQKLGLSSILFFHEHLNELDRSVMQSVILIVIVMTTDYADKAVMCLRKEVHIKG